MHVFVSLLSTLAILAWSKEAVLLNRQEGKYLQGRQGILNQHELGIMEVQEPKR